jgi:DNA topoisomerase-1
MPPAVFDDTTVEITAGDYLFRAKGSVPKFAGWMAVYGQEAAEPVEPVAPAPGPAAADSDEEPGSGVLPALTEGDRLELRELRPEQKFTQPPPRYSEATLVKALEENGIGRPSTYASIIGVLQAREYVNKIEGRFKPTMLGMMLVQRLLSPSFDDILDVEYTRNLEEDLDRIEQGKADYKGTLTSFYKKFKKDLAKAGKEMQNLKEGIKTEEVCDRCGKGMVIKVGKFGPFVACSGYPDCTNTRELEKSEPNADVDETQDETCENCGKPMVVKRGRFGMFLACTGYPECKTTRKIISTKQGVTAARPDQVLDEICPNCGKNLVVKHGRYGEFTACTGYPECRYVKLKSTGVRCPLDDGDVVERKSRRGKVFYGCANYPKCDFTVWNKPVLEPCPKCGRTFLTEKITKRHGRQLICSNEACDFVRAEELAAAGS